MKTSLTTNTYRAIVCGVLFVVMSLTSMESMAQSRPTFYRGVAVSFGTRSEHIQSNIEKINNLNVNLAGGQLGVIVGGEALRLRAGLLGYYTSTGNTPGSMDLYTSEVALHFYPLQLVANVDLPLQPYITGSLGYNQYKFYGHYTSDDNEQVNYSAMEAPYIGRMTGVNANYGIGLQVSLKDRFDFVHLFSEVRFSNTLSSEVTHAALKGTSLREMSVISIGMTFGRK